MKITLQTGNIVDELGYERGYRLIKDSGFQGIDWNIDHAWDQKAILNENILKDCILEHSFSEVMDHFGEEIGYIRKNGLEICQAHAPFPPYLRSFPELCQRAEIIYDRCIRLCGAVGCRYLVIHGIRREHSSLQDMSREKILQMNLDLYVPLISAAKECGVTICIENLHIRYNKHYLSGLCCEPDEAVWLIDTLNDLAGQECFGLCFDTGHFNFFDTDFAGYFRLLGDRIKVTHIHDNDGTCDQHKMPYFGTIDWDAFCDGLKSIKYDGNLNFETNRTYSVERMPAETIQIFTTAIEKIGEQFRKRIQN